MDLSARFRAKDIWGNDRELLLLSMLQVNDVLYRNIDAKTSQDIMDKATEVYQANIKYMEEHSKVEPLPDDERERLQKELEDIVTELHENLLKCADKKEDMAATAIAGKDRILAWRKRLATSRNMPAVTTKKSKDERLMLVGAIQAKVFGAGSLELCDGKEHVIELCLGKGTAAKKVRMYITLDISGMKYKTKVPLSQYDKEILNCIITLYVEGNNVITPRMIYSRLPGRNVPVRKDRRVEIMEVVEKFQRAFLKIRFDESIKVLGNDITPFKKGPLLKCDIRGWQVNGVEVLDAIEVESCPILWDIACMFNRVGRRPGAGLIVDSSCTRNNTVIWSTVAERVASKTMQETITCQFVYDAVDNDMGLNPNARVEKYRIRKEIEKVFAAEKKKGTISDFKPIKKGNVIYGYSFTRK